MLPAFVACALAASIRYDVPADALLAVYSVEGGRGYSWSPDPNGTWELGPLQFNTGYLATLRRWGIDPQAVEGRTCYPWYLAAWRIHNQLAADKGDFWTRVAHYHSYTPREAAIYRSSLLRYGPAWRRWLVARYPTVTVTMRRR